LAADFARIDTKLHPVDSLVCPLRDRLTDTQTDYLSNATSAVMQWTDTTIHS